MRNFSEIKEKRHIIEEAYRYPHNIKPTSRKYDVQPSQIRRWKKSLEEFDDREVFTNAKKRRSSFSKSLHKGGNRKDEKKFKELRLYYDNLRNMNLVVTVNMLCMELRRLSPTDASTSCLRKRNSRWLENEGIV